MGGGSWKHPAGTSSASDEAESSQALRRHWGPGMSHSGRTQTASTEEEYEHKSLSMALQALLGMWTSLALLTFLGNRKPLMSTSFSMTILEFVGTTG